MREHPADGRVSVGRRKSAEATAYTPSALFFFSAHHRFEELPTYTSPPNICIRKKKGIVPRKTSITHHCCCDACTHRTASRKRSKAVSKLPLRYSISPASMACPVFKRQGSSSDMTASSRPMFEGFQPPANVIARRGEKVSECTTKPAVKNARHLY